MKLRAFLALTALDEFWDTSQSILFLGDWCVPYHKKSVWQSLDAEVLSVPYTETDRKLAYEYTVKVHDYLLPILADWLNSIHRVQHSLRYWQIIIGPFLLYYIRCVYNRVDFLKKAHELYPNFNTIGLAETSYITTINTPEFLDLAENSDAWNLQLFTQLLSMVFKPPAVRKDFPLNEEVAVKRKNLEITSTKPLSGLSKCKRQFIKLWVKLFSKKIIVISQYLQVLGKQGIFYLFYASWGRVVPLTWLTALERPVVDSKSVRDIDLREAIAQLPAMDDFSRLVLETLPVNMPLNFIENYGDELEGVQKFYPRNQLGEITVEAAVVYDDRLKFWLAEQAEKGAVIAGMQHGGSYWLQESNNYEFLEHRAVDRFISWGWSNGEHVVPGISVRISGAFEEYQRQQQCHKATDILWVGTFVFRYGVRLADNIWSNQQYTEWQQRFFNRLDASVVDQTVMRIHPGSPLYDYYCDHFPKLNVIPPDQAKTFIEDLCSAKIFIGDNLNTTLNYALAFNIPTILFMDKKIWGIRKEALCYFDALREVGIFHDTPESAAIMLNKVADAPHLWWEKPEVQAARKQYCDQFARMTPHWLKEWKDLLIQVADSASLT